MECYVDDTFIVAYRVNIELGVITGYFIWHGSEIFDNAKLSAVSFLINGAVAEGVFLDNLCLISYKSAVNKLFKLCKGSVYAVINGVVTVLGSVSVRFILMSKT